jgi:hypothetical protein
MQYLVSWVNLASHRAGDARRSFRHAIFFTFSVPAEWTRLAEVTAHVIKGRGKCTRGYSANRAVAIDGRITRKSSRIVHRASRRSQVASLIPIGVLIKLKRVSGWPRSATNTRIFIAARVGETMNPKGREFNLRGPRSINSISRDT